jgi:hypothetical protein
MQLKNGEDSSDLHILFGKAINSSLCTSCINIDINVNSARVNQPETLRALYGLTDTRNSFHGSGIDIMLIISAMLINDKQIRF